MPPALPHGHASFKGSSAFKDATEIKDPYFAPAAWGTVWGY